MLYRTAVGFTLALLPAFCALAVADDAKEKAAVAAAETWLKTMDDENYAAGWKEGAEYLQNAIKQDAFQRALEGVRKPLGKVLARKVKSAAYQTTLPGAPDGEYVVIQFETSFEKKKEAIETVTPMLDRSGKWRVSGYFIK